MSAVNKIKKLAAVAVVAGGVMGLTETAQAQFSGGCPAEGCQGGGTTPPTGDKNHTWNNNNNNHNNVDVRNDNRNNVDVRNDNRNNVDVRNTQDQNQNQNQNQGQTQGIYNNQTYKGAASGSVAIVGGSGQCNSGFAVGFGTFTATGSFSFTKQDKVCLDHNTIRVGLANGLAFKQNTVTAVSLATWGEISKAAKGGLSIVHEQATKCGTNVDPIFLAVKGGCGTQKQYTQKQPKPRKVKLTQQDKIIQRKVENCKCVPTP